MSEEKRTKIGQTGPQRPLSQTGSQPVAPVGTPIPVASATPVPAEPSAVTAFLPQGTTPVPATSPATGVSTSYLPQQVDPFLGQTLAGRYLIQKKLGEGGMGAVYLATHTLLDKQVALKVLHGEFLRKADLVERFMQEAKSASRIRHENVIDISDFGTTPEGQVFFAMELLKGHDLHEEVARARLAGQLLPWSRTKKIFLQICAALQAAHGHGIIHRDLKPENIYLVDFLGEPDFVKLLDFGIAKMTEVDEGGRKLTKTGMLFGTPEYMSPEQARGENVDHRVDVYAMGCILFQLVTGRVPFEADNFMGVLSMHLTEPPPSIPPEVFDQIGAPRAIAQIIDKALVKDRNQRWSSIEELANAIRTACGDPLPTGGTATNIPRQVAASVAKPATTTTPATTTQSRQKTQWTGNLAVPDEDAPKTRGKSKLPLILGALLLVGGAAVAAVVVMGNGGGGTPTGQGSGSQAVTGSGSTGGNVAGPGSGSQVATVTPDAAAPPPELPPLPARVDIKIDSKPRGAEVYNAVTGTKYPTKTPTTLSVIGSRTPVSFLLKLKGHNDVIVDFVPDHPQSYTSVLEKGAGGVVVRQTAPIVPKDAGSAVTKPETGSATVTRPETGSATKPPETGSATKPPETGSGTKPPPDDECVDFPCLKGNPIKGATGSGGSGSDG